MDPNQPIPERPPRRPARGALVVWWSWANPFEHRNWMLFVAVACAILGYHFGEPFIRMLLAGR